MDETIDLRPYVEAIVRYFWLIGGAIVLAIAVGVALYFSGNTFEATALATIPDPTQQVQFDSRIKDVLDPSEMLAAYPELAMSDEVLGRVLTRAQETPAGTNVATVGQLRGMMAVSTAGDPRLFRLTVASEDPQLAAELANLWAEEFVAAVESVYSGGGLEFFTDQLNEAALELRAADDALVAFQTTNRQGIVDNELASLHEQHRAYLTEKRTLTQILDDIDGLRTQLEANATDTVNLADQLAALTVQLRAYESVPQSVQTFSESMAVQAPAAAQAPWQLSIGADTQLTTGDRAQQLQLLDALRRSIEMSLVDIETQRAALEGPIFVLQTEKQRLFNEGERLIRNREIAQETYDSVARKVDEERIGAAETIARVASRATAPEQPDRPNLLVLLPLLAIAAALLSAAVIVILTWWRGAHAS
jgi:uncharacterized protein involved in exopolysaccharide biosynthesis